MCGIAGIANFKGGSPPAVEQLRRMAGALRHRGPDEFGIFRDKITGLAHARLSIIDLVTGRQPLCNENETLWISFNGEIYNYIELREELTAKGHSFRTRSDTEVIVHAYEEWGIEAFPRFNGQFAVALWDSETHKLILARDQYGIRPLYICRHNSSILFASEIKAIFAADSSIPRELSPEGLEETFTFWSIVPPRSVFRGIEELPPGCVRTYTSKGMVEQRFYEADYPCNGTPHFKGSVEDAAIAVRESLEEAVRLRILRSDVPVGCYLSGGLDSSLVASLGLGVKGDKFCTYSLRFEDAEYDETDYQRIMADRLGSEHHEVIVSRRDIAEAFPLVIFHAERPILRTAPTPLFLLSQLVHSSNIKVVLTGEGADEMFAGYDLFREAKVRRFWARQPGSQRRPRLLERLYPYLARSPVTTRNMAKAFFGRNLSEWQTPGFSHGPRWQTTAALKRLFSADIRHAVEGVDVAAELLASFPAEFHKWSHLAQDQYLEKRTLLAGYLLSSQGDRMLMANSVEGRFPFLDPNVTALADSLPDSYKLHVLDEKHILKHASAGLVSRVIRWRKKQPYRAPDALSFLEESTPGWVEAMMSEDAVRDAGVFDPTAIGRLWKKCKLSQHRGQFSNSDNMAVVGVLSTQLLHDRFVRQSFNDIAKIQLQTVVDRVENKVGP